MTEVTRLTEYMEIICDRPYTRNENHIISQNELDGCSILYKGVWYYER